MPTYLSVLNYSIDLLYTDELDGILIKNVFSTKAIEAARKHVESISSEYERIIYGEKLGFSLMETKDDLNKYFPQSI